MPDCISVEKMRQSNAMTIANFVPSLELMGRAAMGEFLAAEWSGWVTCVVGWRKMLLRLDISTICEYIWLTV